MSALDFSRSFVTFVTPGRANNARIQVEARVELYDPEQDRREEFFLVASCKSEHTYAERDLFQDPNYDFCGVFNETEFSIIRRHLSADDDQLDAGPVNGRFERVCLNIRSAPARLLPDTPAVVAATLDGHPIVARTELSDPSGRLTCLIEYPVKTMNANDILPMYQVDTGPVPFPDWDASPELSVARFSLAFVAFNAPDFADFVIARPTELAPGVRTSHYSEIVSIPARNELYSLD